MQEEKEKNMRDLVIIGVGPAGMSAALYASRAGLDVLMLDAGAPGGKLNLTASIENWPGTESKAGPDLAYDMFEHAQKFGAEYGYGYVSKVEDHGDHKVVICDDASYETKAVLVASGTKERVMGIENEQPMIGRGISFCAVCDGAFFRGEPIIVVGGGNSALEEADYLTKFASVVHLVVRRDVFRADKIVQDEILKNDKIQVHFLKKPHKVLIENNKVAGLEVEDSITGELSTISANAIFPYVGADPVSDFVKDLGVCDEHGYILTDDTMTTSCKGIYAAGDVRKKFLRQVVTAANDGATAAQKIAQDIKNL